MKLILTLLIVILAACGGMILLAHHDTVAHAEVAHKRFAPVTAEFSRIRGDKEHLVSIYWRLQASGKEKRLPATIGVWSLKPFRHVTLLAR
ncbi:MAG: hypothetical protein H0X40_16415 [Chthoniobacterales bacterium]|nr:hypothetical protein [Chthoniobacterales bacterium]